MGPAKREDKKKGGGERVCEIERAGGFRRLIELAALPPMGTMNAREKERRRGRVKSPSLHSSLLFHRSE